MLAVELATMKEYVKNYLANGFIRPSRSPAVAPVMFVKWPDGKLRLVVDYRAIKAFTMKKKNPLPLIREMLDRLNNAKIYLLLYHQSWGTVALIIFM